MRMASVGSEGVLLRTDSVAISFGGVAALQGVDLMVDQGELLGVIGPNGAGKTTLFNVITGAAHGHSGSVWFRGRDISRWPPHRRVCAGLVRSLQQAVVFPQLTVVQSLEVAARAAPSSDRAARGMWADPSGALEFTGLLPYANKPCTDLPHGTRKLLGIAMALATSPHLLLLDEPLAGLSGIEVQRVLGLCRMLNKQGLTVVIIEHNVGAVMTLCQRVIVLDYGIKIADAPPEDVRANADVINAYLGAPEGDSE